MRIAIIGYGKMGRTIEKLAEAKGHEIVLKIGIDNLDDFTKSNLQKADVAIEFSRPESAFENVKKCLGAGVPVVCGTTAWLEKLIEAKKIAEQEKVGFIYASNFSVGVNIFFAINRHLAKMMNPHADYNISMEEIHHTQKLDAPSGTAITLAEGVLSEIDRKNNWEKEEQTAPNKIAIASKRIDKVPGTHSVIYDSKIDSIEIKHTAHSREGFASGAILAAEWIVGKEGFFEMKDVLGI